MRKQGFKKSRNKLNLQKRSDDYDYRSKRNAV